MSVESLIHFVPTFTLVFFRLAGMMLFAPLFGSARIPKRLKVLMATMLTAGLIGGIDPPVQLPANVWELAVGIGGEMLFGIAMGMALSFVFIAAQWAGEIIGQQMGFNLSETFDPQFGQKGSLIGDAYFMFALVIFLTLRPLGGHHAMLHGIRDSFEALPLLSVGIGQSVFDLLLGLFQACTALSLQMAAPMLVTMLIIDLALGFISKTIPQLNVMTAGLTIRAGVGMLVLILGVVLTCDVLREALLDSIDQVNTAYTTTPSAR
jgi:flagellar biosynthesis protein FliR